MEDAIAKRIEGGRKFSKHLDLSWAHCYGSDVRGAESMNGTVVRVFTLVREAPAPC